ncbi:MAG: nucleotidyltransferase domain-containing protein [Deltaproteobacteria bacterium]|nr:nucleotidyltransferase domain-containing protein [Deltaproteobacteria bacterium]
MFFMVKPLIQFSPAERIKLKNLSVSAVVLFGSQVQGVALSQSDYDFGVLLNDPQRRKQVYDTLYDILSDHIRKLVNIDIVFLQTASAELQAHVVKHGVPIFEADKNAFADFKAQVMIRYADFAPLRAIFHEGILSRIT